VSEFFPYSQKQLGFDQPVEIRFESDPDNAGVMLGKTAYYDPSAMEIALYVDGRHPKDIMRSLSHELVHHAQNCRGDFNNGCEKEGWNQACVKDMGPGYAQSDPHLRKMEREAYTKGNLIFRDFEDLIKTGKINIEIDFSDSGEPKMSLKEWKNNELNMLLMKKWGMLSEGAAGGRAGMGESVSKTAKWANKAQNKAAAQSTGLGQDLDHETGEIKPDSPTGRVKKKTDEYIKEGDSDTAAELDEQDIDWNKKTGPGTAVPPSKPADDTKSSSGTSDRSMDDTESRYKNVGAVGDKLGVPKFGVAAGTRGHDVGEKPAMAPKNSGWERTAGASKFEKDRAAGVRASKGVQESKNRKVTVQEARNMARRIIKRILEEGQ